MRRFLLLCLFSFFSFMGHSQVKMEDIEVNLKSTATLNFSSDIDYIIFGDNPQDQQGRYKYYEVFQKENTCTFKALKVDASETSIVVKLKNGRVFYGLVRFGSNNKIFYDYTEKDLVVETQKKIETEKVIAEEKKEIESAGLIQERIKGLMTDKDKYFTFGVKQNGLVFQVSNIRNDSKMTYVKVRIKNNTGNDYTVDGIHFRYYLGKRKGIKRDDVGNEERITLVDKVGSDIVKAYSEEVIGLAYNLFAVGEGGKLIIKLEEKDGNRNATIEIEGTDLKNIDIY